MSRRHLGKSLPAVSTTAAQLKRLRCAEKPRAHAAAYIASDAQTLQERERERTKERKREGDRRGESALINLIRLVTDFRKKFTRTRVRALSPTLLNLCAARLSENR